MKKTLSKLSFLFVGLALAATASYLNAADWVGPTSNQVIDTNTNLPTGNVDTPINTSATTQDKVGTLRTFGFKSFGPAIIASSTSDTTYTLANGLLFGVNGKVGATEYCDASGNNCSSSAGGSSVPAGTVAAFNLATCPAGWVPADGTNNTRDLRGVFVRGMESFNGGTTAATTDPDRSGSATLGSYQADMFVSHAHTVNRSFGYGYGGAAGSSVMILTSVNAESSGANGGNETRPKNVALLFCQKDSSVQVSTNTTFAFGGIFSTVSGGCVYSNPYTGNCTCPSGYSESAIYYGTNNGYSNTASYQCYKP